MANSIELKFKKIQKEFLEFLKFTKGHAETTCYNYNSDLILRALSAQSR